jgi:hypothetical protein
VMEEFLTHALPQVEKSLPDWKKLKAAEGAAAPASAEARPVSYTPGK